MKINLYYLICLMLFFSGGCQKDCIETNKPENNIVDADFETDGLMSKIISVYDASGKNNIILKLYSKNIEHIEKFLSRNEYMLEIKNEKEPVTLNTEKDMRSSIDFGEESIIAKNDVIVDFYETNFENEYADFALHVKEVSSSKKSTYPYSLNYRAPKWYHHAKVVYTGSDPYAGIKVQWKTKYRATAWLGWKDKGDWVYLNSANKESEFSYSHYRIGMQIKRAVNNIEYTVHWKHWSGDNWSGDKSDQGFD